MKNWLRNISDADFGRFLGFADRHLGIVKRDHVLQKLTIFNFVAPIIERYKPQTILEIGCGLGFHAALLTRYGQVSATELQVPGSFVTMDKDVASNRATVFGELADGPVQFQVNDGRIFPFADNSFDLIFHNSVIEHVPDATAFNRETRRLLKPGGIVVCITGTPALCRFRFLRDYILRLPFTIAASVIKEAGVTSRSKVSDKIKALLPKTPLSRAPAVRCGLERAVDALCEQSGLQSSCSGRVGERCRDRHGHSRRRGPRAFSRIDPAPVCLLPDAPDSWSALPGFSA